MRGFLGSIVLTSTPVPTNPAEFLTGDKGSDVFQPLGEKVQQVMASAYGVIIGVGVSFLVLALILAGIFLGVSHDPSASKDTKKWILRILIGAIIVGTALSIVGVFFGIGSGFGG